MRQFIHFPQKTIVSSHFFKILNWWAMNLWLRAISHTRLKARDHCNLRALIGWMDGDRPSSIHTQRWRPRGPKRTSWTKSLLGVLHGRLWIGFHGLPEFSSSLTQILGDHDFFNIFSSMTYFRIDCNGNSRTNSRIDFKTYKLHQVILSNW